MRRFLILDYETRSEADLKRVGSWEYSLHHSTQILCVAWRYGTREELRAQLDAKTSVGIYSPFSPSSISGLIDAIKDPETILTAHNALFEEAITANVLSRDFEIPKLPPERWLCTASLASALALPRSLEGACSVLGLKVQKDTEGRKLVLKMCKPRKPSKKDRSKWQSKIADLNRIMLYCQTDVDAETELFLAVPPLTPMERNIWVLDQKINLRGFSIDEELVDKSLTMIAKEVQNLTEETFEITLGEVKSTSQREATLRWLNAHQTHLPDLKAKTVADTIAAKGATNGALRLLEIRQAISKTSTAKFQSFLDRSASGGRVRDSLIFHAASTGRWGGAGVQVQNLPRPKLSQNNIEIAIEAIKSNDFHWLQVLFKDPMPVFSSCLRGVIVASPGHTMYCADYASIEARMLFWFANHEAGLKAFREDRDLYCEMASKVYGIPADKIKKDSIERFVGKSLVLGAGYQLGAKKFMSYCLLQGIEINETTAKAAIDAYRRTHYPVKQLWYNLERGAIAATKNPGKKYTINHTVWFVKNKFLWCELPSGRRLAYYKPELKAIETSWGEMKATLHHMGMNPMTRKWELAPTYGGRLTENIIQAASRDLLAEAMLRIEAKDYKILISVHDEILAERDDGLGSVKEFEDLMAELPEWATGAPVKAIGWSGNRYRK